MVIALAAGILVATILFLIGLSLDTIRRVSKQNNSPELFELQEAPENHSVR
ncbi:MAG TPA: hypothetical protein VED37_20545 [Ktedonobacteraceae bacterium]|nr:hypothetical protein [Ktedonobacteraceae bacterium]